MTKDADSQGPQLSEGLGHGARYAEWRDFYGLRVTGWMRLEQLRIECARLQDAGNTPSPELLLVHAMHELERLRAALEKIADWHGAWGPFPEGNEAWRAMAIVTAREAVPLGPNVGAERRP